ncbi:unnamed protein product [Amoebophrya sp. A120]|nr:unnamed protein product [Amoebophrya sp. A120]|eukprot:GSA120T00004483001.1
MTQCDEVPVYLQPVQNHPDVQHFLQDHSSSATTAVQSSYNLQVAAGAVRLGHQPHQMEKMQQELHEEDQQLQLQVDEDYGQQQHENHYTLQHGPILATQAGGVTYYNTSNSGVRGAGAPAQDVYNGTSDQHAKENGIADVVDGIPVPAQVLLQQQQVHGSVTNPNDPEISPPGSMHNGSQKVGSTRSGVDRHTSTTTATAGAKIMKKPGMVVLDGTTASATVKNQASLLPMGGPYHGTSTHGAGRAAFETAVADGSTNLTSGPYNYNHQYNYGLMTGAGGNNSTTGDVDMGTTGGAGTTANNNQQQTSKIPVGSNIFERQDFWKLLESPQYFQTLNFQDREVLTEQCFQVYGCGVDRLQKIMLCHKLFDHDLIDFSKDLLTVETREKLLNTKRIQDPEKYRLFSAGETKQSMHSLLLAAHCDVIDPHMCEQYWDYEMKYRSPDVVMTSEQLVQYYNNHDPLAPADHASRQIQGAQSNTEGGVGASTGTTDKYVGAMTGGNNNKHGLNLLGTTSKQDQTKLQPSNKPTTSFQQRVLYGQIAGSEDQHQGGHHHQQQQQFLHQMHQMQNQNAASAATAATAVVSATGYNFVPGNAQHITTSHLQASTSSAHAAGTVPVAGMLSCNNLKAASNSFTNMEAMFDPETHSPVDEEGEDNYREQDSFELMLEKDTNLLGGIKVGEEKGKPDHSTKGSAGNKGKGKGGKGGAAGLKKEQQVGKSNDGQHVGGKKGTSGSSSKLANNSGFSTSDSNTKNQDVATTIKSSTAGGTSNVLKGKKFGSSLADQGAASGAAASTSTGGKGPISGLAAGTTTGVLAGKKGPGGRAVVPSTSAGEEHQLQEQKDEKSGKRNGTMKAYRPPPGMEDGTPSDHNAPAVFDSASGRSLDREENRSAFAHEQHHPDLPKSITIGGVTNVSKQLTAMKGVVLPEVVASAGAGVSNNSVYSSFNHAEKNNLLKASSGNLNTGTYVAGGPSNPNASGSFLHGNNLFEESIGKSCQQITMHNKKTKTLLQRTFTDPGVTTLDTAHPYGRSHRAPFGSPDLTTMNQQRIVNLTGESPQIPFYNSSNLSRTSTSEALNNSSMNMSLSATPGKNESLQLPKQPPRPKEECMQSLKKAILNYFCKYELEEAVLDRVCKDHDVKSAWKEIGRVPLWKLVKQFPSDMTQRQLADGTWKLWLLENPVENPDSPMVGEPAKCNVLFENGHDSASGGGFCALVGEDVLPVQSDDSPVVACSSVAGLSPAAAKLLSTANRQADGRHPEARGENRFGSRVALQCDKRQTHTGGGSCYYSRTVAARCEGGGKEKETGHARRGRSRWIRWRGVVASSVDILTVPC